VKKPIQAMPGRWIHTRDGNRQHRANGEPDKTIWRRVRRAGKRRRTPEHIEVFKTVFRTVLEGIIPFVATVEWLRTMFYRTFLVLERL